MYILGISAFYHDSAAALIKGGEIIAAVQEERFTRKKHDPSFPINAIKSCLQIADISPTEIQAIAFYDKPLLKFERLLETYYAFAPRGIVSFINSMPVWMKQKLFLKRLIKKELKKMGFTSIPKLLFPEHHLSHASSAFYPSGLNEAAILTIDGVGEWATASICHGKGNSIEVIKEMKFPHSLGLLYSAFCYFLGFKVNSGEYKMMGLAPFGNESSEAVKGFIQTIETHLIDIHDDGSFFLNQKYFSYATGLRMVKDRKFEKLFGIKRRKEGQEIKQIHADLALAIQRVTEKVVRLMAVHAMELGSSKKLCLAGGVALNSVSNGKLLDDGNVDSLFIQAAAGDSGGALGSALAAYHIYFGNSNEVNGNDKMKGALLGPSFTKEEIKSYLDSKEIPYRELNKDELNSDLSHLLSSGKIIGRFSGRMEFGPRALGNRSILADPRSAEMQKKLNLKIKFRESFRPFAPVVLEEYADEYFELNGIKSPYMLLVKNVKEGIKIKTEKESNSIYEKLQIPRSKIPAVTHVDYSARIQTLSKEVNSEFHDLISTFYQKTGCPILINTSFNVRGKPIVNSPEDAYECFMASEMDALVMENCLLLKEEQDSDYKKLTLGDTFMTD